MPPFSKLLSLALLAGALAGCSEYTDRRDMISVHGGDAVQTDKVVQMIDPWPPHAADRNIAYNGNVMQGAVQRYRTGKVIRPVGTGTSETYQAQQPDNNSGGNNAAPLGPTVNQTGGTK
jgi:hypothetical protein